MSRVQNPRPYSSVEPVLTVKTKTGKAQCQPTTNSEKKEIEALFLQFNAAAEGKRLDVIMYAIGILVASCIFDIPEAQRPPVYRIAEELEDLIERAMLEIVERKVQ